jgi:hypothetical protein
LYLVRSFHFNLPALLCGGHTSTIDMVGSLSLIKQHDGVSHSVLFLFEALRPPSCSSSSPPGSDRLDEKLAGISYLGDVSAYQLING